ncbi:hypothetical protein ACWDUM_24575 [Rhodococcus sp. NPDC003322]
MAENAETVTTVIMLIRHAERPPESGPPYGVDDDGDRCDESLTEAGWRRATALAGLFAPDHGEPAGPLARPRALFASTPSRKGGSRRSLQTLTPLAARLGLDVDTEHRRADVKALAKRLRRTPGPVLVSWQREYLPDIVAALGDVDADIPDPWPEDRYDLVWVLTRTDDAWTFTQAPQLLLPGDLETGI